MTLTPSFASMQSLLDMSYPEYSTEYRSNREAWYAVGVAGKPKITSFDPTKGKKGTTVTINGGNFTGVTCVVFKNADSIPVTDFLVYDSNTIVVQVPNGAVTGPITVVAGYHYIQSDSDFQIGCDAPLTVSVTSSNNNVYEVNAIGGTAPYTYSLDNINFQSSNIFTGLVGGQTYTAYVKDTFECKGQVVFFVSDTLPCNVQAASGGQGTSFYTQLLGTTPGSVSVEYEMYTIPDQIDVYYDGVLMASTNALVSGNGTLTFNYNPPIPAAHTLV